MKMLNAVVLGFWLLAAAASASGFDAQYEETFQQQRFTGFSGYFERQNRTGKTRNFLQLDNDIFWRGQLARYRINYTKWTPQHPNGKVIIYNHGFQSHKAWFNETAEQLHQLGYVVYAFDRIGSGRSSAGVSVVLTEENGETTRSLLRKRGHIDSWQVFTHTIHLMKQLAKSENIGASINLWANSFAAVLVTAYLEEYRPDDIDSVVFTTPGLYSSSPLPFTIEELINAAPGTYFESTIPEVNNDRGAANFTSDPIYFDAIKRDRKSLRQVTREYYFNISWVSEFNELNSGSPDSHLPAVRRFYLLVDQDPLMNNVRMMEYIRRNADNAIAKIYQGGPDNRHFLTFTEDAVEAVNDIDSFYREDTVPGIEDL